MKCEDEDCEDEAVGRCPIRGIALCKSDLALSVLTQQLLNAKLIAQGHEFLIPRRFRTVPDLNDLIKAGL